MEEYKEYHHIDVERKRERLEVWLLLSLLFHALLMFMIQHIDYVQFLVPTLSTSTSTPTPTTPAPPDVAPPDQNNPPLQSYDEEIPFTLDMKENSHFGATVLFQEDVDVPSEPPLENEKDHENRTENQEVGQQDTDLENGEEKDHEIDQAPAIEPQPIIQETINPVEALSQKPATAKKRKRKKTAHKKKGASPITHAMTLAKLSEGFLEYVSEKRHEEIPLSTNDLKYACYMQKVGWFLQNSLRLNNKPVTLSCNIQKQATLHLEIDEQGNLTSCFLSPNTSSTELDTLFIKACRGATPFPPLPQHFNKKKFKISLPIQVDVYAGTRQYDWIFQG